MAQNVPSGRGAPQYQEVFPASIRLGPGTSEVCRQCPDSATVDGPEGASVRRMLE
jgi:hypothetical protein